MPAAAKKSKSSLDRLIEANRTKAKEKAREVAKSNRAMGEVKPEEASPNVRGSAARADKPQRAKLGHGRSAPAVLPTNDSLPYEQFTPKEMSVEIIVEKEGIIDHGYSDSAEPEAIAAQESEDEQSTEELESEQQGNESGPTLDARPSRPPLAVGATGALFKRALSPMERAAVDRFNDDYSLPGIISLSLPAPIRGRYAAAKDPATPLRDYLARKLTDHVDLLTEDEEDKPFFISGPVRREIERVANRNFDTAEELLGWLVTTTAIRNGRFSLRTDQDLIDRALVRKDPDQSDSDCLSEMLTAGIEIKTGLR